MWIHNLAIIISVSFIVLVVTSIMQTRYLKKIER